MIKNKKSKNQKKGPEMKEKMIKNKKVKIKKGGPRNEYMGRDRRMGNCTKKKRRGLFS
jgi:hypothetical protein